MSNRIESSQRRRGDVTAKAPTFGRTFAIFGSEGGPGINTSKFGVVVAHAREWDEIFLGWRFVSTSISIKQGRVEERSQGDPLVGARIYRFADLRTRLHSELPLFLPRLMSE